MLIGWNVIETVELEDVRDLVSAGAITTATILGQDDGYTVHVRLGNTERILVAETSQVWVFVSVDLALEILVGAGLSTFTVVAAAREKTRPEAFLAEDEREYVAWFRAQVREALKDEAEGRTVWRDHADVMNDVRKAVRAMVAERNAGMATKEVPLSRGRRRKSSGRKRAPANGYSRPCPMSRL